MLTTIREAFVQQLWAKYRNETEQMQLIEERLLALGANRLTLDHFAVIDLPSIHSGIPQMERLLTSLGYRLRGRDYLPDKQNDFAWLVEDDCSLKLAAQVLPQAVIADFRLHELPSNVRQIIEKYTSHIPAPAINHLFDHSELDADRLVTELVNYFAGRCWPLPTVAEYETVKAHNELLAWVLVYGRKPNHFTLSIHHLTHLFSNLSEFIHLLQREMGLALNQDGGVVKGSREVGIEQGSTLGVIKKVDLADGTVFIPTGFVEFVWRYPSLTNHDETKPMYWNDYFTGFIAKQADNVIRSLYNKQI